MKSCQVNFNPPAATVLRRALAWGALALLVPVIFAGCSKSGIAEKQASLDDARPPVAVDAAVARTGDMMQGVDVTGSLKPKFEVDVKSEMTGLVKKVYVREWVPVKRGALLAQIDIREWEAAAGKAVAARESARASHLQAA